MDSITADFSLQDVLGRGGDFVGGIDNEALDFSQLEAFINSDGSQGGGDYFNDTLTTTTTATTGASSGGKLLNVIVENKRPGHALPESPPDSSSEHPYSPQDSCDPPISSSDSMYTTLEQPLYKTNLLNPIITDNLILGSHIVVTDHTADPQLIENGTILADGRLLVNDDLRTSQNLLQNRIIQGNEGSLLHEHRMLLQDNSLNDSNRQILIQNNGNSNQNYPERTLMIDTCPRAEGLTRRNGNDIILVKNGDYEKPQLVHLGINPSIDMQQMGTRSNMENPLCEQGLDNIQNVYTNLQNTSKKRKLSQDSPLVKSEPEHCSPSQLSPPDPLATPLDDDFAGSESCLSEAQYQCIKFSPFQQTAWHTLCDQNLTELPSPHYRVDADKGFNFSNADDAFVCQKKNHFQITCHIQLVGDAQFVKTNEGIQKISSFHLHFYGVKHDSPTQTIRVEQSQSDRSKKPFHPVLVELVNSQVTKITVGRLHFSETTSNNMRKKGKPNPEQRYFQLVVGLHAHTSHGNFPIVSHASQKIIVRASNPGQFENDIELCWQKGQTQDSIFHGGKVGINTDRPDESLVVHGNIKITGHIIQPSDIRAKKNIVECDTAAQLRNVQKLRVVRYEYEPSFASQLNRTNESSDTGVIAQEVAEILPEAVSPAGDLILDNGMSIDNFLVVNKERIFMENIGAVKELCKVTDNLETRIDQLERINRRLTKLKRGDSLKSNSTASSGTKHIHYQKCLKNHSCHNEIELCSTKFIQIIIIVLVLIMAFCLAAITTLYLMEAANHNSYIQHASMQSLDRMSTTKKPTKNPSFKPWNTPYPHRTSTQYKAPDQQTQWNCVENVGEGTVKLPRLPGMTIAQVVTAVPLKISDTVGRNLSLRPRLFTPNLNSTMDSGRETINIPPEIDTTTLIRSPLDIIGRPPDCLVVDQDFENTNICQIYCCNPPSRNKPELINSGVFNEKRQKPMPNRTKVEAILDIDKKSIGKPFNNNNIDKSKQERQKRESDDWINQSNDFGPSVPEDQIFTITIQGRNFNKTLTTKYLINNSNNNHLLNFTYHVPISKYMPDEYINLTFKSTQANIKDVEHCYNDYRQNVCSTNSMAYFDDPSIGMPHKVNENQPIQQIAQQSVTFEVHMIGVQWKIMTYRAALRQTQSVCKLSSTKLGLEYMEYNFRFFRVCDE